MFEDDDKEDKSQNESDKETEDKEDSEDSSSNDEEDTDNEEDDKGDLLKQYAKDPNSVPKELRGTIKKLLGSYTKKMQEASGSVKKAKAFDQLYALPEFQRFIADYKKGVTKASRDNDDSDDDDEDKPLTRKEFKKLLASQREEDELSKSKEQLKKEADKFKKDHPDWMTYKSEMDDIWDRYPDLSYEDCYGLATRDSSDKESESDAIKAKKRANTNKPNRHQGKESEKKGKLTFLEAFEKAKNTLTKK